MAIGSMHRIAMSMGLVLITLVMDGRAEPFSAPPMPGGQLTAVKEDPKLVRLPAHEGSQIPAWLKADPMAATDTNRVQQMPFHAPLKSLLNDGNILPVSWESESPLRNPLRGAGDVAQPAESGDLSITTQLPMAHETGIQTNPNGMDFPGGILPIDGNGFALTSGERTVPPQVPAPEVLNGVAEEIDYYDCKGGGCCTGCRKATWIIGSEATFLSPNLNQSNVRYTIDDLVTPQTFEFVVDDLDSVYVAPRIWLGVQGECWGIVARYWRLSDSNAFNDPFIPSPGFDDTGVIMNNRVDAYTFDLQLTRAFCVHASKLSVGVGARYAIFEHDKSLLAYSQVDDNTLIGSARANRYAYGTGVTTGIQGRTPLFCDSCVHLFYGLRTSLLWGSSNTEVETSARLTNPVGSANSLNGALVETSDQLFIGEVQLGLEWNYQLQWLPAQAFFRIAAEYQYWDATRGDAGAFSFADEVGVLESTAVADSGGLAMNLVGFSMGAGFTW